MNLRLLDSGALRARVTGRSFWAARFSDGRVITEAQRDWTELNKRGMVDLRLYCPSGQVVGFGNTQEAGDRLFQLKVGLVTAGQGRGTLAHLIGLITTTDGGCTCYAWDYRQGKVLGPWTDNVHHFLYENIGALSGDALGIRTG